MNAGVARKRAAEALWWVLPIIFLFWLYRDGLKCWFIADDFAWLGLLRQVHGGRDLVRELFEPAAQGTIRPWSERGFFLLFEALFGLDALPFRLMAFLTMAADLVLLTWVMRRITHSRLAGPVACITWTANAALMVAMTWSSALNEALCACFLLAALALFIRYTETGERRFWWGQLAVFVLGFGALEINVVYPALAAAYAWFAGPRERRRRDTVGLWPLAAVSVAYFFLHRAVAPFPKGGDYALHVDARMWETLRLYAQWSLLPVDWEAFGHSHRAGLLILWLGIAGLAALAVGEWRRRRAVALFFVAWYAITLAPVLPLPGHRTDYYLTIPGIGLGMLAGWGVTCASRGTGKWRVVAAAPIMAYLAGMIPVAHSATRWSLDRTRPIRALILGVEAAHETHPGKAILLDGIPKNIYADSIGNGALYPLGFDEVYLTPESRVNVVDGQDLADPDRTVLDPDATFHALRSNQVVIYSIAGDHLRNITERYARSAPNRFSDRLPSRIDIGNPLYSWLLGPSWHAPEAGVRWMPGKATVRLRGPETKGSKLVLEGDFPAEQLNASRRHLIVTVDGGMLGETEISEAESSFRRLFEMPDSSVGKDSLEIGIQADPVTKIGGADYSLLFGKLAIHP